MTRAWHSILPGMPPIVALLLLAAPRSVQAVSEKEAASLTAVILAKALAYDSKLRRNGVTELRTAVVFKPANTASEQCSKSISAAFSAVAANGGVGGLPVHTTRRAYTSIDAFKKWAKGEGINTLFLCGGLDGDLDDLLVFTQSIQSNVLAGSRDYVARGVSLGVTLTGSRLKIVVNVRAASAHGHGLSSKLLKVSEVIR